MNRTRMFVFAAVMVGSGIGAGAALVGCSDDPVQPVADSGPDTTTDVNTVDVVTPDVGPDVADASDASDSSKASDAQDILAFMDAQVSTFCGRYAQCCFGADASAFDSVKCRTTLQNGWDQSLRALQDNDAAVVYGGRLTLNPAQVATCLANVATFTCPTITSGDLNTTSVACFGAVTGTQANGQPCNTSIECANGYCVANGPDASTDAGLGTCTPLLGSGQGTCNGRNEECQVRGYLGTPARCDIQKDGGVAPLICTTRLANGAACTANWECASGTCDFITAKCATGTLTTTPFACGQLTIKDAGGGG